MTDAQRIALLREEFGYQADIAFATAETGTYCRHDTPHDAPLEASSGQPESIGEINPSRYVLA